MRLVTILCLCWCFVSPPLHAAHDIVIYGGTSAGIAAAIQAQRMGKSVVLIEPSQHLGGLTTGGLGYTDSGNKNVVGGVSREFYQRIKKYYDQPASWKYEKRETYKNYRADEDAMWTFEPHIAERIYRDWLTELKIPFVFGQRLDRSEKGIKRTRQRITAIIMESGQEYAGKMFIDATYEGDLLALAGVSFTVGREANAQYKEILNGVAYKWNVSNHRFIVPVDPYVRPGDPKSGLLHGIDPAPYPAEGSADHRLQAYCFRMCMSNVPENRVPFPKPNDYDEAKYELLFRNFEAGDLRLPLKPDMMPNGKTDTNNNCAVSTDYIGQNHRYPEASYAERDKIIAAHVSYQQGLMWSLSNHPRVPQKIRDQMAKWGLAKDEFTDSGNWPHQIYVREARRMVSDYVITEADCRRTRETPASVGMGSYNMDSHNCMRYVTPQGKVQNEGDVQVSPGGPYRISYLSIVPKKGECPNLFVPVCVSSSHIAYGSIRMEPVFMVLGQSSATAASMAIDMNCDVQAVPYEQLRERLLKDKQVLEYAVPARKGAIDPKKLPGVVVDDADVERVGFGPVSESLTPFIGTGYRHDGGSEPGKHSARFRAMLPQDGMYEVRFAYTASNNRASKVPITITHADGSATLVINQRKPAPIDGVWISLGTFPFKKGQAAIVEVKNDGADGHVIIDAVQWLPKP